MKIEYMVQEKSKIVKNCWLNLNRGHFFQTKKEAKQYLTQYQSKHPESVLRIVTYEWVDGCTVNVKEA